MNPFIPFIRISILCFIVLNAAACQKQHFHESFSREKNITEQSLSAENLQKQRDEEQLKLCQKQLSTLQSIKDQQYQPYKQAFDSIMKNASQYARLRTSVNVDTQETVDALYRYRVNYLCAEVNQAVLTQLTELAK